MKKAFISYRRQDSAGHVRALHDRLVAHFDPGQIFMDVDDIALGTDFVQELDKNLQGCTVMLVVIGPQWLDIQDSAGRRRLDNPNDFVRLEVLQALERGLTVIPILVNDAPMPSEQDLPEVLKLLSRRQALELDNKRYNHGVSDLIQALEHYLGKPHPKSAPTPSTQSTSAAQTKRSPWLWAVAGLALIGIGIAVSLNLSPSDQSAGKPTNSAQNSPSPSQQHRPPTNTAQPSTPTVEAGFDCRQASNDVEDAICNDDINRKADQQLNQIYQKLSRRLPPEARERLKARQINWVKQRNTHIRQNCFTQTNKGLINRCIYNYYQQRISTLSRIPGTLFSRVQVIDPPTNIRTTPNGAIICQVESRQMIEVYTDAIQERDGDQWYWSQVCGNGRWGLVHKSQISTVR